ncbi:hypothetical protein [Sediminibacterium soli]|uniref:hypothetical protein n=1 Tax=Sediminibacterium soli TaxID=2698829 RepID=UPI00137A4551|nr:hypothetical protein [Sediminibacterium soli]NCI45240.1 hypothetical protein [Sediminibacterium soli]
MKKNLRKPIALSAILFCCQVVFSQASMTEVLNARLPQFPYSVADNSCKQAVDKKYSEYKAQDQQNSKLLTNQLQSHMNGWVEINPGTCNAGGPPPICPVNHWVKDGSSMQRWTAEQNAVRVNREIELRRILENCNTSVRTKQEKERQAYVQAENERVKAENERILAEERARQERLDNALRGLQNDIAANNRETEDELDRAREKNTLNTSNQGAINKAKDILNNAKVTAGEVFGDALGALKNKFSEEDNNSMDNMGASYNDYERSGGENYSYGKKIASKILGIFKPKQDTRVEDIPDYGYNTADESASKTSRISSIFSSIKEKASWLKPTLPPGMVTTIYRSSLDQLRKASNGEEPIDADYVTKVGGTGIGNFIGMGIVGAGIWGATTIVTAGAITAAPAIAVGGAIYLIYNEGKKLKDFIKENPQVTLPNL